MRALLYKDAEELIKLKKQHIYEKSQRQEKEEGAVNSSEVKGTRGNVNYAPINEQKNSNS